jgi:hypothetical protein
MPPKFTHPTTLYPVNPSSPTQHPDNDNDSYAEEQMNWYSPGRAKSSHNSSGTEDDNAKPSPFESMIQKFHIGTTLAALVLFLLPWIDIRCSQQSFATQTGIQTIYGGASLSAGMEALAEEDGQTKPDRAKPDGASAYAPLVALALLCVVGAVVMSFMAFRSGDSVQSQRVGMLCAAALVLISAQMMIGFPAKKGIGKGMAEASKTDVSGDPMDEMSKGMAEAMMLQIDVRHLPALYLTLVMLGLPTLVLANGMLDRLKKG